MNYDKILKLASEFLKMTKTAEGPTQTSTELGTYQDFLVDQDLLPVTISGNQSRGDQSDPAFTALFNEYAGMVQDTTQMSFTITISPTGVCTIAATGNGRSMQKSPTVRTLESGCTRGIQNGIRQGTIAAPDSNKVWPFLNFTIQF